MTDQQRRKFGWILAAVFFLALFMGAGPGVLLVNQPKTVSVCGLSLPYIYAWGLFWYFVEATCIVLAFVFVWRQEQDEEQQ